jgi:PQQ-dependent catabolism-associated CXXCW motif protein
VRATPLSITIWRLVFGTVLIGCLAARAQPPEPEGYRTSDYRAPTPATVAGGSVLTTETAHELWKSGNAVWIDVLPTPRRPLNLPASALWAPLPREDIPGSLWLPDVGRGELNPELEHHFKDHLEAATEGRPETALVFYCLAECWMSWNAAKRAASWGYSRVYWYPEGIDGWQAAKLPTERAEPIPGP